MFLTSSRQLSNDTDGDLQESKSSFTVTHSIMLRMSSPSAIEFGLNLQKDGKYNYLLG